MYLAYSTVKLYLLSLKSPLEQYTNFKKICMTVFPVAPFRMSFRRVRNTVSVT